METVTNLEPMRKGDHTLSPQELQIQRAQRRGAIIRYVVLTLFGLLMLYPLIWLVGASFKTNEEIFSSAAFWPKEPTIQGYIDGWQTSTPYTFARFFLNSLYIVIPKMIGTAISSVIE